MQRCEDAEARGTEEAVVGKWLNLQLLMPIRTSVITKHSLPLRRAAG